MTAPRSPWLKLRRNPAAVLSAIILVSMALEALLGPSLAPIGAGEVTRNSFLSPSSLHLFGTDLNGRDLLYRNLLGPRISLFDGMSAASTIFILVLTQLLIADSL